LAVAAQLRETGDRRPEAGKKWEKSGKKVVSDTITQLEVMLKSDLANNGGWGLTPVPPQTIVGKGV